MPGEFAENLLLKLSGLKAVPGKLLPRPTPFILTWLGPQPIGVIPPEWYGLPEDYFFGFTPEEVLAGIGATQTAEQRRQIMEYSQVRHEERLAEINAINSAIAPPSAASLAALEARLAKLTAEDRAAPNLIQQFDIEQEGDLAPQLAEVRRARAEREAIAMAFEQREAALFAERSRLIAAANAGPPSLPSGFVFLDGFASMHPADP